MNAFRVEDYLSKEEATLEHPVICYIVLIENIAESKEKALEEWKYILNPNKAPFERMEHVNRPIIYGVDLDAPPTESSSKPQGKATYKLTMKDSQDNLFYGFEFQELPFLHPPQNYQNTPLPIPLGAQIRLEKGTRIIQGVVDLDPIHCKFMSACEDSPLLKQLNAGIVNKYISLLERQLEKPAE